MKQLLITFAALVLVGCGPSMSIYEAAKGGNIEAVMKAIEFGLDINDVDNAGETALEIATIEGHIDIIVLLIDKGADVNFKNSCGFTTLHTAAFFRHKEIFEIFIQKGAVLNAIATAWKGMFRENKMTPLDWMSNSRNMIEGTDETADLLRKHGCKTGEELKAEGK